MGERRGRRHSPNPRSQKAQFGPFPPRQNVFFVTEEGFTHSPPSDDIPDGKTTFATTKQGTTQFRIDSGRPWITPRDIRKSHADAGRPIQKVDDNNIVLRHLIDGHNK